MARVSYFTERPMLRIESTSGAGVRSVPGPGFRTLPREGLERGVGVRKDPEQTVESRDAKHLRDRSVEAAEGE
jgi:hypothetical protein